MNRVRLRPTGVSGGEYINASFLDVSQFGVSHCLIGQPAMCCTGVQVKECLHGWPGSTGLHSGRLLEDGVGVQEQGSGHAVSANGGWPGQPLQLSAYWDSGL